MIKCAIITDIAVWSCGAGHIARLRNLIDFLVKYSFVTIIYIGRKPMQNVGEYMHPRVNLVFLEHENKEDELKNIALVNKLLNFEMYKVCFVEYIHLSYFLKAIPDSVISILDAHDIISERNKSFNSLNYPNWDYHMPAEREFKIFRLYDKVMLISQNDFDLSGAHIGSQNLILGPHPVVVKNKENPQRVRIIGFVASDYLPNVDAICWFMENVWSLIPEELELQLHIYGVVSHKIPARYALQENIVLNGFVPDLDFAYSKIDIAINPVRIGSGMKIKNMEALSYGIPLITTDHGARGIKSGVGQAFLVAETDVQFAEMIIGLVTDNQRYQTLSENSKAFIMQHFSDENCFQDIKKILQSSVSVS